MDATAGVTLDWALPDAAPVEAQCRNCGAPGPKTVVLNGRAALPGQGRLRVRLLDCPACGCAFADEVGGYRYSRHAADALSIATYVEAGAGLWPIARTLARLKLPPGSTFLEIGCGFGFGLDFAARARHWHSRGVDPSPLAAAGRSLLGVSIDIRYFGSLPEDSALPETARPDGILASEVLEHVEDPLAFLTMLKAALRPEGVLVLTTPDRSRLQRDAGMASLVPLVSVGAHMVLQSAASLRALLARAGFAHATVEGDGDQLVAYASRAAFTLEDDPGRLRGLYRDYLGRRIGTVPPFSSLWWGFASRAYLEAVADADSAAATRYWAALQSACRMMFGFDPDRPARPQRGDDRVVRRVGPGVRPRVRREAEEQPCRGRVRRSCILRQPSPRFLVVEAVLPKVDTGGRRRRPLDLAGLAELVPKSLPGLLYARALHRLHQGGTLDAVSPWFRRAVDAAAALNEALLPMGAADLAALSVFRQGRAALAALAADRADPGCLGALSRAIEADPREALPLARRSFVGLVNAGDLANAARLRSRWSLGETELERVPGRVMSQAECDTLFCLAMLALHEAGQEAVAARCFAKVRDALAAIGAQHESLWWSALRGECVAADREGRQAHSTALLRAAPLEGMPDDLVARLG